MPAEPIHDPNAFSSDLISRGMADAGQTLANGSPQAVQQFASQVQAWAGSAAQMKAIAGSGGFAVDPKAGQAYVDLYNRCINRVEDLRPDVERVVQRYQLGTTPGAQQISPWNLQVAQQLQAAFSQLITVYGAARDAYAQAMKNYVSNEQDVADTVNKAARS